MNSGQLPQSMSLLEKQQYHPKTKVCNSCRLNRLASNHSNTYSQTRQENLQCNRYQRVKFPKEIASAQMKNITVTQPKIVKHLQDKDIPYLNKER